MTDKAHIIVPSGLKPVHSFDLYGPIVDSEALSEQSIKLFQQIAELEGISPEDSAQRINDYRALARGEPWATGERKLPIVDALHNPLDKYPELKPDYKATFQEDGLYVLRKILDTKEGVIIFSSKVPDWLQENLPEDIGTKIDELYGDQKYRPEAFKRVYDAEREHDRQLVSHTADELPELVGAAASGLDLRLVYVNRNDSNSQESVTAAGIHYFVSDLREVPYTKFVKK